MGDVILVLVVLAVVAAGIAIWSRQRRSTPKEATVSQPTDPFAPGDSTTGDPRSLKAGDMLDFETERSWVRGTLRFAEGGSTWAEHFIEVDDGRRWLSVEEDPDLQLVLWTARPDLDLLPGARQLEVEGVTYRFSEKGTASYRSEGTTGLRASGGADYADYEGPGGKHLAFERFDHGSWEVSLGVSVLPGTFTIFPGS